MQTSLFPQSNQEKQPSVQAQKVSEQSYIQPLTTILENVIPQSHAVHPNNTHSSSNSIKESLESLFPEQQYDEKNIQSTKKILGSLSENFTTEQLRDIVSEVQHLTENCLDAFEKSIFEGITLKELLHEK